MTEKETIEEARDLLEDGQPEEALELLDTLKPAALDGDTFIDYSLLRAEALTMLARYEEALSLLSDASRRVGQHARLLVGYANVLSETDRLEEALLFYHRAARLDRASPWVNYNWGLCLQRLGYYEKAVKRFRKAYEASSEWVRAFAQIAECYRLLGRVEKAEEALLHYLDLAPDDDYERVNLGTLYSDADRYDEAITEFEKALAGGNCDPAFARYNWGVTALRMGDVAAAREQFKEIESASPHCPGGSLLRAQIASAEKSSDVASIIWKAVRDARESDDDEWRSFAYVQAMHLFRTNGLQSEADLLCDQADRTEDLSQDLLEEYREAFGAPFQNGATYQVLLECFRETEPETPSTATPPQRYYRNVWVCAASREEAVRLACDFERRFGARPLKCREVARLEPLKGPWKAGVYRVSGRVFFQRSKGDKTSPPKGA
ncbi:MAG: tetratricopeptide repeat protein [Planctomycetota bacterium]